MGLKSCTVCQDSYPEKPGDIGICRLCEIRERGWRNKIANEVQALGANTFIVQSIKRGPRHTIGGMSDLTIPDYDVPLDMRHTDPHE